jgi:hypothetical protein
MGFSSGYLTPREKSVWDLRRKGNTQSEIGRLLGISRQAAHRALGLIDVKVERAFSEAAETNGLEVRSMNIVDGIMEAYSPVYETPVFVSFSRANGLRIWYLHEGDCGSCSKERSCMSFLEAEAAERGIQLSEEDHRSPPTQLALKVFGRYLGDR